MGDRNSNTGNCQSSLSSLASASASASDPMKTPPLIPRRVQSRGNLKELDDFSSTPKTEKLSPSTSASSFPTAPTLTATPLSVRQSTVQSHSHRSTGSNDSSVLSPQHQIESKLKKLSFTSNSVTSGPVQGLTKRKVRLFMEEFHKEYNAAGYVDDFDWYQFFGKFMGQSYIQIRPSGNPMTRAQYIEMFEDGDTKFIAKSLVSIDSIHFLESTGNQGAIVTFTTDETFSYKGTENADRAVYTAVLELQDGEIKLIHEHRTKGTPIPKETRWA